MPASRRCASRPAPTSRRAPLLEIRDIAVRFGGIVALVGVSFEIEEGEILGLIGPNGAGKTTLFNCVSRLYTPNRGDIVFEGRSMLARPPHRIAEIGIGRTFQNLALFAPQSVFDNVRIGGHARSRSDFASDALRLPWVRRHERDAERDPRGRSSACSMSKRSPCDRPPACRSASASGSNSPARSPEIEALAARRAGGRAQSRGGRRTRQPHPPGPRRNRSRCSSSNTT